MRIMAMWRTNRLVNKHCFVRIVNGSCFGIRIPDMVKSMISQTVSSFYNHLEFLGMLPYIVAYHLKELFHIVQL